MKKITFTLLIFLTLLLNACASTPPATEAAAKPIVESVSQKPAAAAPAADAQKPAPAQVQTGSGELNTNYENAVPVTMQLLLGTFKLEGTELAVTAEQAATLTPLWTNFKSLSVSMRPEQGTAGQGQGQPNATPQPVDSGLQTKLDEIVKQIQSAMTPEQIKAIAAMQITQDMSITIMKEQGITMTGKDQQGNGGMLGGGGQRPAGGDMAQGTPPAGGPSGGGQQPGGGQMGTPPAGGMQPNGMGFVPSELIDALIQLLEQKTGS
jgi:hypothetical protein